MDYRWDDIRTFLCLARQGSLTGAARELGVNASTVARRLDALEEALGTQLFERRPEGVIATLAAERLVPFAEAIERANHDLVRAVGGLEREPEGKVTITGPPGLIDHFIAPAMEALRAKYPRLRVVLDASVGYADLSRGAADIALRAKRPESGDLIAKRLGPYTSAIIGSRERYGRAAAVTDVNTLPWIQWGDDLVHIPDAVWVARHVDDTSVVLRTSSMSAQIEAVRAGVGVMLTAAPFGELPGLCVVPWAGKDDFPRLPLFLVGHTALRRVPRVAVTWDFLVERLQAVE